MRISVPPPPPPGRGSNLISNGAPSNSLYAVFCSSVSFDSILERVSLRSSVILAMAASRIALHILQDRPHLGLCRLGRRSDVSLLGVGQLELGLDVLVGESLLRPEPGG